MQRLWVSQLHGKTYFRLEHYLSVSVLDKMEQAAVKEKLPRLHSSYYGVPEGQAELEQEEVRPGSRTSIIIFRLRELTPRPHKHVSDPVCSDRLKDGPHRRLC
jgi:hypothetical protein